MPLRIIREDLTKIKCDAIVNPTNVNLVPGGGIDAAVHVAAGPELFTACQRLGGLEVGQVKMTPAYNLPCKHIFHTVGPWWEGGHKNEKEKLQECYRNALLLAESLKLKSLAMPLISSGTHGYPKDLVMDVAIETIKEFLEESEMLVYFVVFDSKAYEIASSTRSDIEQLIDNKYVYDSYEENLLALDATVFSKLNKYERRRLESLKEVRIRNERDDYERRLNKLSNVSCDYKQVIRSNVSLNKIESCDAEEINYHDLPGMLKKSKKTFQDVMYEYLDKFLDKHDMKESKFYTNANITKSHWSKIRAGKNGYVPTRETVIAIGLTLQLTRKQMDGFLAKAGYALSDTKNFDLIIMYCIAMGIYDVQHVDFILEEHGQKLLSNY